MVMGVVMEVRMEVSLRSCLSHPEAPQGFARRWLQPRLQSRPLPACPRQPGKKGRGQVPVAGLGPPPRASPPCHLLSSPASGAGTANGGCLMAPPSPAAGGHRAGDEALHASSPPRQEHAWHRQGSSTGPPHALLPNKEQGRHLASVGCEGWGTSFQEIL